MDRFDTDRLRLLPLGNRIHDLGPDTFLPLDPQAPAPSGALAPLVEVAEAIRKARASHAEVVMFMGGHVIRSGAQRHIIDMMQRGLITALSMNGSCVIHDFEFALIGSTTESVSRYISEGQFGLWQETGRINDIINEAYENDATMGLGGTVGKAVQEGDFPYKDISILAAAHRLAIPANVHVSIGQDIIHEHPNFNGAATGALSHRDFLSLAAILDNLKGGVVMNFGSAVMAPEVYLKALAMARNKARQEGRSITRFTTLVCDLHDLPSDVSREAPKDSAAYYFRPWKTMLARTVADGGRGIYVRGRHDMTIPALRSALIGAVIDNQAAV